METVIIGIILAISVLLVLIVLAQNSKGGGVSGTFGGSGAQVMGAKRTTDFLEKLTWGLVGGILVLSLMTNVLLKDQTKATGFSSPNFDKAKDEQVINPGVTGTGEEAVAPDFEADTEEGAENTETPTEEVEVAPTEETTEEAPAE